MADPGAFRDLILALSEVGHAVLVVGRTGLWPWVCGCAGVAQGTYPDAGLAAPYTPLAAGVLQQVCASCAANIIDPAGCERTHCPPHPLTHAHTTSPLVPP